MAVSEMERSMICERVRRGVEREKREGKRIGRPSIVDDVMRKRICRLKENGSSLRSIAEIVEVSRTTVQKVAAQAAARR